MFDPFVAPDVIAAGGGRAAGLHELLETADFVSINCPLTPETRGLIGPAEIALLRPTAYLLNLARGGIVDEAALLAALRERRIAGAALDCFADEPYRGPLAGMDRVQMTAHMGTYARETRDQMEREAATKIVECLRRLGAI